MHFDQCPTFLCHWARLQDLIPIHTCVSLLLLEPLVWLFIQLVYISTAQVFGTLECSRSWTWRVSANTILCTQTIRHAVSTTKPSSNCINSNFVELDILKNWPCSDTIILWIQIYSMDRCHIVWVDNLSNLLHIKELREWLVEHLQSEPKRQIV